MTALDTNVLVALWDAAPAAHEPVREALDRLADRGGLMICAPVFSELRAGPGRTDRFLDQFLAATGIGVDWHLTETIWRAAGAAFQAHAARSGKQRPRRILADFVIGAHAQERCGRLFTLDTGLYRASFPQLELAAGPRGL